MKRQESIGRAELELLRYVADHAPATVREVAEHLAAAKGQTRTTALNVMERLREKGFLTREKVDGVYRYSPSEPKGELLRRLVRDFIERALGGSLQPFVAYLAQDACVTDEQLADLKRLVRELEAQREEAE
jgi:predicted transcriptional regulator